MRWWIVTLFFLFLVFCRSLHGCPPALVLTSRVERVNLNRFRSLLIPSPVCACEMRSECYFEMDGITFGKCATIKKLADWNWCGLIVWLIFYAVANSSVGLVQMPNIVCNSRTRTLWISAFEYGTDVNRCSRVEIERLYYSRHQDDNKQMTKKN